MFKSFIHCLQERAQYRPNEKVFINITYLNDNEFVESTLTYNEVNKRAQNIAGWLQKNNAEKNNAEKNNAEKNNAEKNNALLLYPPIYPYGLQYITALLGCFYAKVIAVPVYPPLALENLSRLAMVIKKSKSKVILSTSSFTKEIGKYLTTKIDGLADLPIAATE